MMALFPAARDPLAQRCSVKLVLQVSVTGLKFNQPQFLQALAHKASIKPNRLRLLQVPPLSCCSCVQLRDMLRRHMYAYTPTPRAQTQTHNTHTHTHTYYLHAFVYIRIYANIIRSRRARGRETDKAGGKSREILANISRDSISPVV